MNKKLKDPEYLPTYGETINLSGRNAPVRIDIPDMPPPTYDVEAMRDMHEHVPHWILVEGCCRPVSGIRAAGGAEAGSSGTLVDVEEGHAGAPNDVEAAEQPKDEAQEAEQHEGGARGEGRAGPVPAEISGPQPSDILEDQRPPVPSLSVVESAQGAGDTTDGIPLIVITHPPDQRKSITAEWGPPPSYA
ncbi:hypothetical protein HDV00_012176 [Rhizophlyctis rosea]|nr:hypothetical protein HDV00_012176 [Rhizophlyctis rosea]